MRDRLIELIRRGMNKHEVTIENYVIPTSDYLADYLLENGVIVPPCKVGDKLYIVAKVSKEIVECTIIGAWVSDHSCTVITDCGTIHNESFGKTVFLTIEEAEQALKGGEGE